jgi:uncharacterized protein YggE
MIKQATTPLRFGSLAAVLLLMLPGELIGQPAREIAGGSLLVVHPAVAAVREAARIELAVESVATTATGARAANELAVQRVLRALTQAGVPAHGLALMGTSVHAEYERFKVVAPTTIRGDRRVAAYRALTGVSVEVPNAERVGWLLDVAHAAGARYLEAAYISAAGAPSPGLGLRP